MGDLPDWWCYPEQCGNGHLWGPGLVRVGWTPCPCAGGPGHLRVHCVQPGCHDTWYDPPHDESVVTAAYPKPVSG